jgi:endoglucanase
MKTSRHRITTLSLVLASALAAHAGARAAGVNYVVADQWNSGFKAEITVVNDSASTLNGWRLEFDYPYAITQFWNATIVATTGSHYVVTGPGWSPNIAPNGSFAFGFIGASSGAPTGKPSNCLVNGLPVTSGLCGGGSTPPNLPPLAKANGPYTATANTALSLSAAGSSDPDGSIVSYNWNFGDGSAANSAGTQISHTYTTQGSYSAKLTVTDNRGATASGSAAVTVNAAGTPNPGTGTPLSRNGQLKVCGTQLCNAAGKQVQLRGMSGHGLQWFAQCYSDAALDAASRDWGADIFRLAMYVQEGGYETDPAGYKTRIDRLISAVNQRGMYALVDWHILNPGNPLANLDKAKDFFAYISKNHSAHEGIIYEIANEPNGTSWADIKSYAEQVIPVIRANDPKAVILVGTRGWSSLGVSDGSGPEEMMAAPVNATNIMYSFHFYAASHKQPYLDALSRSVGKLPLFVTEFGTQTYSGDGANDFVSSQTYIDFLAAQKISWVNWNFADDSRSGSVFNPGSCASNAFTGSALKESGRWVQQRLLNPPDNF